MRFFSVFIGILAMLFVVNVGLSLAFDSYADFWRTAKTELWGENADIFWLAWQMTKMQHEDETSEHADAPDRGTTAKNPVRGTTVVSDAHDDSGSDRDMEDTDDSDDFDESKTWSETPALLPISTSEKRIAIPSMTFQKVATAFTLEKDEKFGIFGLDSGGLRYSQYADTQGGGLFVWAVDAEISEVLWGLGLPDDRYDINPTTVFGDPTIYVNPRIPASNSPVRFLISRDGTTLAFEVIDTAYDRLESALLSP